MTTLSTVNIPMEFRCTTEFLRRGYRPMNEIAFYINTLLAMYDLSLLPQQSTLPDWKLWELPNYGVRVAAKTTQIRYAVWGLWQGVQRDADAGFWPMALKMSWSGTAVGQVNVAPRQSLSSNITDELALSASDIPSVLQALALNTTTSGFESSPDNLGAPHFQYNITPNGRQITVKHLFQTAFATLVASAEQGPSTPFPGWISDDFTFVPVLDARGRSLMVYGNLIKAMTYLATTAVEHHYFNEVDIEVVRDGVAIGHGRLRNPRGVGSE